VRREDFPSLEMFSRIRDFDEKGAESCKNLALVGLDGGIITNMKRPKF